MFFRNTVEEPFNEETLQNHVDHNQKDEAFSCNAVVEPFGAIICAGKAVTFANVEFSEEDYGNLHHKQKDRKAVVASHLIIED